MKGLLLSILVIASLVSCKQHRSDKAGKKMQDFIVEIGDYAHATDPDFILIPQNGVELLFDDMNADGKLNERFVNAIDGYGVEELYYNGGLELDDYRLNMLLQATSLKVMVADYNSSNSTIADSYQRADANNFIAFPRASNNYDYQFIPDSVHHENANNITNLSQAQNYLYLISTSGYPDKASFLAAIQQTNFDVVIIDAFYDADEVLSATEVNSLKTKANGGQRLVIAYMNIGAAENYRYYWKSDWKLHKPRWLKKAYDGYPDEIFVKYWKKEWKDIIYGNDNSYTKKILDAGFDGTYLDNVEAFYSLYFND